MDSTASRERVAIDMRVRTFHQADIPVLVQIQQIAARADQSEPRDEREVESWLREIAEDARATIFVGTDDDDELQTWGQGGTLEGIEGEIVGYTVVQEQQDEQGYHLLCQGAVLPEQRRRRTGWSLFICALNWARLQAAEFEYEARSAGLAVYFEALLPAEDPGTAQLAQKCELTRTDEPAPAGLVLYRCEL